MYTWHWKFIKERKEKSAIQLDQLDFAITPP